jgi:outer membrane protein assembly factor BamB
VSSTGRHIWSYPDVGRTGDSVQGYTVQAADGRVGKVYRAATAMDSHCLVVGTGTWISARRSCCRPA